MTDSNTVQCIPITIISDSTTETEECFTYTISTTSTAAGLTLNPTSATICITDEQDSTLSIHFDMYNYAIYHTIFHVCILLLLQ